MIFDFNGLCGGIAAAKYDEAVTEVLDNMQDPETSAMTKRKVIITLTFSQNEKRNEGDLDIDVITKLAPKGGIRTRIAMEKDLETGIVLAAEYRAMQLSFDDLGQIDEVEEFEEEHRPSEESKVIDFRKVK